MQQIQSMEKRMMTMYSYFKQMRSGSSSSGAHYLHPHLHHLSLLYTVTHPETKTRTTSRILTIISIHRFYNLFLISFIIDNFYFKAIVYIFYLINSFLISFVCYHFRIINIFYFHRFVKN